jgi:hypothetical protein
LISTTSKCTQMLYFFTFDFKVSSSLVDLTLMNWLFLFLLIGQLPQFTRPHRCDWWAPSDWTMPRLSATLEPPTLFSLPLRDFSFVSVTASCDVNGLKGNTFLFIFVWLARWFSSSCSSISSLSSS